MFEEQDQDDGMEGGRDRGGEVGSTNLCLERKRESTEEEMGLSLQVWLEVQE